MSFFGSSGSSPTPARSYTEDDLCTLFDTLLLNSVREQFAAVTANERDKVNLFVTKPFNLFEIFLNHIPAHLRQYHTCSACRKFMERYGGIVTVAADGKTIPVMWNPETVPELYAEAVSAIADLVARSPIDDVFLSEEKIWGVPKTDIWHHFAVTPLERLVFKPSPVKTTEQVVAEKKQDYKILVTGLAEFPIEIAQKAYSLVATGSLYRSEKCIEVAKWFVDLHEQRRSSSNQRMRENLTWLAVANAPPGFCHIRSTIIGTLLEDIKSGLAFAQIKSRFDAKMNPLQYQRPTASPAEGNIAQAEKIVEKLKTTGSLERRFAKLADLQSLWVPVAAKPKTEKIGVFSHLKTAVNNSHSEIEVPPVTMTWDKFSRTVLPTAAAIEFFVPNSNQSYMALITAKNPDAPPIIQWDFEGNRNPVTWYFYVNGSSPLQWNLKSGIYHPVTAIVLQPSMWDATKNFTHQGEKVFFLLKGAKDKEYRQGCGFYPEFLKNEYHGIRSTLEAYAQNAVVEGKDEAEGCGIGLIKGFTWNHLFRVTSKDNLRVVYKLDRWD